jgi:hypothetical protein
MRLGNRIAPVGARPGARAIPPPHALAPRICAASRRGARRLRRTLPEARAGLHER